MSRRLGDRRVGAMSGRFDHSRIRLMSRTLGSLALAAALLLAASCAGAPYRWSPDPSMQELLQAPRAAYPPVRFAVASDLHFFDLSLGSSGAALQRYLDNDRKMLLESAEILDEALAIVREAGAQFLLVPGDLTKDGERVNHEEVARRLEALERAGTKVYVVPGNHDINNPHAVRYSEQGPKPVPGVSPQEFAEIYRESGYGESIARDAGSLSYVAEPVPGLWLLAIDSCDYADNLRAGSPATRGRLDSGRRAWVEGRLEDAARRGKAVIAFLHHGLIEHFRGQRKYAGMFLLDDGSEIARMLAAWGVRVVFTGHFHAQDAVRASWDDGSFLYDVETGSLVTAPVPVRLIDVDETGRMSISTRRVTSIPSFRAAGKDFASYAEQFTRQGVSTVAVDIMRRLWVSSGKAAVLAPQASDAFLAHYEGDERFSGERRLRLRDVNLITRLLAGAAPDLLEELWNDLPPADNDLAIDLSEVRPLAAVPDRAAQ